MHKVRVTVKVERFLTTELELDEYEYDFLTKYGELPSDHLLTLEEEALGDNENIVTRVDWRVSEGGKVVFDFDNKQNKGGANARENS